MTDITKLRAELRGWLPAAYSISVTRAELTALLDALDAAERERDYGLTAADVADEMIRSRIPNCFLLDPPDRGDVKTWESVERIIAAMYKAERERDEARRIIVECINRGTDGGASEACSMEFLSYAPNECEAVKRQRDEARRERDEARALASEAIDEVESWGNYAPDWTKEKWDFVATLDDLRGRLWKDRAP